MGGKVNVAPAAVVLGPLWHVGEEPRGILCIGRKRPAIGKACGEIRVGNEGTAKADGIGITGSKDLLRRLASIAAAASERIEEEEEEVSQWPVLTCCSWLLCCCLQQYCRALPLGCCVVICDRYRGFPVRFTP